MTVAGSLEGRLNAVRVLARSPDRARASERLAVLFGTAEGELRRAALSSLAQQGGPENLDLMRGALSDPDPEIVRSVLRALSLARERAVGPAVVDILRSARTAAPVLPDALFYLRQCPEAVDDGAIDVLVALADNAALAPAARVSILEALPAFRPSAAKLKKPMEPLLQHADLKLREAAQICMVLVGDRGERRNLLKAYDSFVEENATWPKAFEQRGDVLLRIGDAGDAAKDFKRALELSKDSGDRELWIKLARAYAPRRQAASSLRGAGLGVDPARPLGAARRRPGLPGARRALALRKGFRALTG